MIVNLTKIEEYLITLDVIRIDSNSLTSVTRKHAAELMDFLKEVREDLELGGESIIELDKQRVDAIRERNEKYKTLRVKK